MTMDQLITRGDRRTIAFLDILIIGQEKTSLESEGDDGKGTFTVVNLPQVLFRLFVVYISAEDL